MNRWVLGATVALALPVCAAEHNDTYQRTFPLGSGARKLIVENINGTIRVTGESGNDVRATVREHFTADTPELLATGRSEVRVEMKQDGNTVRLYLDGPFRDRRESRRTKGYRFRHEFELQVPRDIDVELKTVNAGKPIEVTNVRGVFSVRNVNGGIQMNEVAGAGSAETVNGPLNVNFVQNPRQPSSFKTVNGAIEVRFQPDLSADIRLRTMHGDGWTDFEYQPLAAVAETTTEKGSKGFRFRMSDRHKRLRIGAGGVEHSFQTVNGSITIRKYGK
jgi:hypothetical protein